MNKPARHTFTQAEVEELGAVWQQAFRTWMYDEQSDDEVGKLLDRVGKVLARHGILA